MVSHEKYLTHSQLIPSLSKLLEVYIFGNSMTYLLLQLHCPPRLRLPTAVLLLLLVLVPSRTTASIDILVTGFTSDKIFLFDESGSSSSSTAFISNSNSALAQPHASTLGPDNNLYIASAQNNRIVRYNPTTSAYMDVFVADASGGLSYPVRPIFRGNHLYVTSQGVRHFLKRSQSHEVMCV